MVFCKLIFTPSGERFTSFGERFALSDSVLVKKYIRFSFELSNEIKSFEAQVNTLLYLYSDYKSMRADLFGDAMTDEMSGEEFDENEHV